MKKLLKSIMALTLSFIFALSVTVVVSAAPKQVTVNIFQFKVEISDALKAAIKTYTKANPGVKINLETVGGGDDYGAALRAKMSESTTIFNIGGPQDLKDWSSKLEDLSDQPWVSKAVSGTLSAVTTNKKVYGMPYSIEGYGFIYNKNIFADAGIDVSKLNNFASIEAAFKTLKTKIDKGELKKKYPLLEAVMEFPAKETWVTGLHTLNIGLNQEFKSGVDAYNSKTVEFKYAQSLKKLYDLQANYSSNANKKSNLNAVDYSTQVGGGLAIERVAVIQQGNWIYPDVVQIDKDVADNLGILPMPLDGVKAGAIPVGVPMYWAINSTAAEAEKAAAKEFLNWLYQSDEGKKIVVDEFFFIPPFTNYDGLDPKDSLGIAVKSYADTGNVTPWVFMGFPTDWGMNVFGAKLQDYFSGKMTYDQVVKESKDEWAKARK